MGSRVKWDAGLGSESGKTGFPFQVHQDSQGEYVNFFGMMGIETTILI